MLWRRYSPLEQRLLLQVRSILPAAAQPTFDAQVNAVTLVQRRLDWTEIAFYRIRYGKSDWNGVPLFPREGEFPLAEVRFRARGRSYKARLTVVQGHIFDFATTPGPRDIGFAQWETAGEAGLLSDPTDASPREVLEQLPTPWQEFLAVVPRGSNHWLLHGAATAYRLAMNEGEFLVLAERAGDGFLLYRLEPHPRGFFIQSAHDHPPEPLRQSLREILCQVGDPGSVL